MHKSVLNQFIDELSSKWLFILFLAIFTSISASIIWHYKENNPNKELYEILFDKEVSLFVDKNNFKSIFYSEKLFESFRILKKESNHDVKLNLIVDLPPEKTKFYSKDENISIIYNLDKNKEAELLEYTGFLLSKIHKSLEKIAQNSSLTNTFSSKKLTGKFLFFDTINDFKYKVNILKPKETKSLFFHITFGFMLGLSGSIFLVLVRLILVNYKNT